MCNFVSWIEKDSIVYFLTNNDLNTKEGRKLLKTLKDDDILGHGAVRAYWGLNGGVDKECEDFSKTSNFPKEIIVAIKKGQMSEIGFNLELLNSDGQAEYEKIKQSAWAEYEKIEQPAWAEYEKIKQSAFWKIFKQKKYRNKVWQ